MNADTLALWSLVAWMGLNIALVPLLLLTRSLAGRWRARRTIGHRVNKLSRKA